MQYGLDNCALPKVCPLAPQGTLAHLAAEFDQGANQVGDGPPMLKVANAFMDSPLEGDIITALTIATADAPENTSEVEPDLARDLASSMEK